MMRPENRLSLCLDYSRLDFYCLNYWPESLCHLWICLPVWGWLPVPTMLLNSEGLKCCRNDVGVTKRNSNVFTQMAIKGFWIWICGPHVICLLWPHYGFLWGYVSINNVSVNKPIKNSWSFPLCLLYVWLHGPVQLVSLRKRENQHPALGMEGVAELYFQNLFFYMILFVF